MTSSDRKKTRNFKFFFINGSHGGKSQDFPTLSVQLVLKGKQSCNTVIQRSVSRGFLDDFGNFLMSVTPVQDKKYLLELGNWKSTKQYRIVIGNS